MSHSQKNQFFITKEIIILKNMVKDYRDQNKYKWVKRKICRYKIRVKTLFS